MYWIKYFIISLIFVIGTWNIQESFKWNVQCIHNLFIILTHVKSNKLMSVVLGFNLINIKVKYASAKYDTTQFYLSFWWAFRSPHSNLANKIWLVGYSPVGMGLLGLIWTPSTSKTRRIIESRHFDRIVIF